MTAGPRQKKKDRGGPAREETTRVGRRGTIVIPAPLRRRFGLEEGSYVIAEARDEGVLIRPATVLAVETYTPERRAEFLLTNAVDAEDYRRAVKEVRRMGLDPEAIPHEPPPE
ncbi:MAG: AbrB/MazE/SpoVT family DNA-binding domain-containing protein [Gemmatimonadota bacterium]